MSLPGEIEDMKQRMLTGLCSPLGLTCVHMACSHCLGLAWLLDCLELYWDFFLFYIKKNQNFKNICPF